MKENDFSDVTRGLAVALAAVVSLVHLVLVPEHFHMARYVGILFLIDALAAGVAAIGIYRKSLTWGWLLGFLSSSGAFIMYFEVRWVGLPGFKEGSLWEPMGILALAIEAAFIGIALLPTWKWFFRRAPALEKLFIGPRERYPS